MGVSSAGISYLDESCIYQKIVAYSLVDLEFYIGYKWQFIHVREKLLTLVEPAHNIHYDLGI